MAFSRSLNARVVLTSTEIERRYTSTELEDDELLDIIEYTYKWLL